jgi:hypothetical protein
MYIMFVDVVVQLQTFADVIVQTFADVIDLICKRYIDNAGECLLCALNLTNWRATCKSVLVMLYSNIKQPNDVI